MEESDSFSFGAKSWRFVDQPDTGRAAFLECPVEIVHGEANVVNSGPASRDEFCDWSVVAVRLEQLNQRVAGFNSGYSRPVGVADFSALHAEDIGKEGQTRRNRLHGDSDVSDAGALGGFLLH